MNFKKITILLLVLLVADQALKIWIKTHMTLDEAIMVVPTWFQLRFIENNGAAFGIDRKSTRQNSSHGVQSRMPSSA